MIIFNDSAFGAYDTSLIHKRAVSESTHVIQTQSSHLLQLQKQNLCSSIKIKFKSSITWNLGAMKTCQRKETQEINTN